MKKLLQMMFVSVAFALVAAGCAGDDAEETTADGAAAESATDDETQGAEVSDTPEDESALADEGEPADQSASGEPGSDELCAAFADLSATTDATASLGAADTAEAEDTLRGFADALENLENAADDPQLATDAAIVSTPMQEIIALYEAANWDLEAVSSDPDALVALSELSSPEVIAATERITTAGQTRCGIDLDG